MKRFVVTAAFVVGAFVLTGCNESTPSDSGGNEEILVPPPVELDLDFDGTKTKTKTVTPTPQVVPVPQQRRTNTANNKPGPTKR